ncbi:hypothetical protein [Paenibacillus sp. FSL R5-0923]
MAAEWQTESMKQISGYPLKSAKGHWLAVLISNWAGTDHSESTS